MSTERPWNYTSNKGRAPYVNYNKKRTDTTNQHQPPSQAIIPSINQDLTPKQVQDRGSSPPSNVKDRARSTLIEQTTNVYTQTEPEQFNPENNKKEEIIQVAEIQRKKKRKKHQTTSVYTQTKPEQLNPDNDKKEQTTSVYTQTKPEQLNPDNDKKEKERNVSIQEETLEVDTYQKKEKSDDTEKDKNEIIWKNMTNNQPPRIVLSITGSRTWPHQKQWSFENLHKAIYDTTRKCRECGVLFNKERTPEIEKITKSPTTLLEPLQSWSYSKSLNKINDINSLTKGPSSSNDQVDNKTIKQEMVKCEDYIVLVEYESFINKKNESTEDVLFKSPVALVVVHGDLITLEHVARTVQKDLSVTVIKGTGGTADLLASCYDSLHNLPRKIPTILGIRIDDDLYSRIIRIMKIIHEKHWLINTFDLENDDEHVLWTRVTNGIYRAWSLENVKVSEVDLLTSKPIFDSEVLSVSKYVTDCEGLSKKEIFEGLKVEPKGSEDSQNPFHQNMLFDALKEGRLDILKVLLANNVKLTDNQLKALYDEKILFPETESKQNNEKSEQKQENENQHDESKDKVIKCIHFWMKVDKKTFETFTNPVNNAKDYKAAAESVHYTLLKGSCLMSSCFNIGGTKCCMPCCVKPKETKDTETRNSDILLKCMVTGDYDELGILWSNCDTPMYTALIVSRTMRALSELAVEMAEDKWVETFKEQEQLFSNRAIFILEKLSEEFPDTTAKALTHDSEVWGMKDSPIHFSKTFAMEEFSAHSVAHKDANCTLYGAKQINTFWDFIHHHAITETSTKIFSAPLTRIIVNLILHIAALVCYSVFLITDVRMETISSLIIVVFVFVIGDLYEELKFLKRRVWKHFSFKMILLHFNDIWRSMDLIFWILFLIGFFMHASKIEELYLHTRRIYSVALFLMFMHLLKMMLMIRSLGIMVIMVKEMLKDLLKFLMVASVFMFAAGIIYHANIYPNHTYSAFSFDNWRFWQLLKIPYWQIYGELYLDTLEGSDGTDCTNNETIWSTDPTAERCSEYDWLAIFIAAVYMMLVNWLLLNIVIAMFSSQYERVHSTSEQKWRHHRNIVAIDYQHRIPSPINLIIRPIKILIIGCVVGANACARKHETPELSTQDLDNQKKFAKTRIEEEEKKNRRTKKNPD